MENMRKKLQQDKKKHEFSLNRLNILVKNFYVKKIGAKFRIGKVNK